MRIGRTSSRALGAVLLACTPLLGCSPGSGVPSTPDSGYPPVIPTNTATAGAGNSLAVAPDGRAVVSYSAFDGDTRSVRLARCEDPGCTRASISVIEDGLPSAVDTAVAIGSDGLPLIAYAANGLRVGHCEDPACTAATLSDLETTAFSVGRLSLAIGSDGRGLISYRDTAEGELEVAHCEDLPCTSATVTILADAPAVGHNSELAMGSDGLGLIGHFADGQGLRVARCLDVACTAAEFSTVEQGQGVFVDGSFGLAIGIDGLPLLAYDNGRPGGLRTAHCADVACSVVDAFSVHPPEATGDGYGASMGVGVDGLPFVAYHGQAGRLTVTHCEDLRCESSSSTVLEDEAYTISVGVGGDGLGLVSYLDNDESVLKMAHCEDVPCTVASVHVVDDGPLSRSRQPARPLTP